jgi:hypothetical protein
MKLQGLAAALGWECLTPTLTESSADITKGYVSDLLSDVLAHGPEGGVLVTVQVHLNVIAVATHAELAAVVFVMDRRPEEDVLAKAVEEGVRLYTTKLTAFETVGRLYQAGLRGPGE